MSLGDGIARAMIGASRLLVMDEKGLQEFDNSVRGFWASFSAILLSLPFILFQSDARLEIINLARATDGLPVEPDVSWFVTILAASLTWVAFPILMIFLARFLDVSSRYVLFVIAYNWAGLLMAIIGLLPELLFTTGLIGLGTYAAPLFAVSLLTLVYHWYVLWKALAIPGATAFALLILMIVTTLIVNMGVVSGLTALGL